MSITDGEIAERLDVRPASIDTKHIRDDAVATAKIPDLAVTFPDKIDNPIWVDTFFARLFSNATLTVLPDRLSVETTVDVPAWVDSVSVLVAAGFQFTNTSGVDVLGAAEPLVDGEGRGFASHEAPNNSTVSISITDGANLIGVAGSSVAVGIRVSVQGGTITSNAGWISGILMGHR